MTGTGGFRSFAHRRLRVAWQPYPKLAVFADLAFPSDAAAMLLRDDIVGDRQAKAVPSPVGLVVKNGWNSLSLMSARMPVPLPRTRMSTASPKSRAVTFSVGMNPASPLSRANRARSSPWCFRGSVVMHVATGRISRDRVRRNIANYGGECLRVHPVSGLTRPPRRPQPRVLIDQ